MLVCVQRTQSAELSCLLADALQSEQLSVHSACVEERGVRHADGDKFLPDGRHLHRVLEDGHR